MAEIVRTHERRTSVNGNDELREVKWAKHYSSNHQILLVGEGDFSFSMSLAMSFGFASNIVASSLDSYDDVMKKYKRAKTNLEMLCNFGAQILHGVDSTRMKLHTDLRMRKFDRIVYNFPHAGFLGKESDDLVIMKHRNLVRGFLRNASGMLRPNGEIHVTHKAARPFDSWNIEELATQSGLTLIECVKFKIEDYPGYNNKRGAGRNPDQAFPLGECNTFKFIVTSKTMKLMRQKPQEIPLQRANEQIVMNPLQSGECFWIFKEYFNHARSTFGEPDYFLPYNVPDMLRLGFERYNADDCGKPLDGYLNHLEELWNLCRRRLVFLRNRLWEIDHPY
ncbi:unnamed protein product [Lactuca virosa]|uniref:25S rRNA (uridine-N(3))-methyltransferase BMT5-like domain-containing protein n=1 Tax=Lactuca virosa TaxID=75947 RepID=A0AAU9MKU4_9ASTR|nr:unnamed protein product [Lactuca virosa]